MSFKFRILSGILGFIFLIWGILGLFPFMPGGILCFPISILFFKLAKIPVFSRFVSRVSAPFLSVFRRWMIWFEKKRWGIKIRVRVARLIRWMRSKRKEPD